MVDTSNMSLPQLRAYRVWLERDRTEFLDVTPKPEPMTSTYESKLAWYESELRVLNSWIDLYEGQIVRKEMDAKAYDFLHPQSGAIEAYTNSGLVKTWIDDFKYFMRCIFKGTNR